MRSPVTASKVSLDGTDQQSVPVRRQPEVGKIIVHPIQPRVRVEALAPPHHGGAQGAATGFSRGQPVKDLNQVPGFGFGLFGFSEGRAGPCRVRVIGGTRGAEGRSACASRYECVHGHGRQIRAGAFPGRKGSTPPLFRSRTDATGSSGEPSRDGAVSGAATSESATASGFGGTAKNVTGAEGPGGSTRT